MIPVRVSPGWTMTTLGSANPPWKPGEAGAGVELIGAGGAVLSDTAGAVFPGDDCLTGPVGNGCGTTPPADSLPPGSGVFSDFGLPVPEPRGTSGPDMLGKGVLID